MREQAIPALTILLLAALIAGTSYACQQQTNEYNRVMHEKGFCSVQIQALWVWRPCDTLRQGER